jgi:GTP-binding protein HflX
VLSTLRRGGLTEEDLTDLALLRLDAIISVRALEDGLPGEAQLGHLLPPDGNNPIWRVETLHSVHEWADDWNSFLGDLEAQFARCPQLKRVEGVPGAILVGISLGQPERAARSMAELGRLAHTAGLEVLDSVVQHRRKLDGRTTIGTGKLSELVLRSMHLGAEVLVFDRELSPSQLRNIAEKTELAVLDRTQLILDIFAQHAQSREGKLQVELAQLRYRMPRLALMPTAMSRLGGGIGGRGPGESKLEINRRRATERVTRLERQLKDLAKNRVVRRRRRARGRLPIASIVGYTNAGKSTLLNQLTRSEVLTQDKLFATLDPTTRRLRFPEEREIIVTDTVGFIEDLPDTLVAAFASTLEELQEADLLLHVLDANSPNVDPHRAATETQLERLDLSNRPSLLVWNKADVTEPDRLTELVRHHGGIPVSAHTGEGCAALLHAMEAELFTSTRRLAAP